MTVDYGIQPDEGLCLEILHTASAKTSPSLAVSVVKFLKMIGVPLQEHHVIPYVEANIRSGKWYDVIASICSLRELGVIIERGTLSLLVAALSSRSVSKPPHGMLEEQMSGPTPEEHRIDAFYAMLKQISNENDLKLDSATLNAVIEACAKSQPVRIDQAVEIFQGRSSLGIQADTETYNSVLLACCKAERSDVGYSILTDMRASEVRPNKWTFELSVELALGTNLKSTSSPEAIDEALENVAEMRRLEIVPSEKTYTLVIGKLAQSDHPKLSQMLRSMVADGHHMKRRLRDVLSQQVPDKLLKVGTGDDERWARTSRQGFLTKPHHL